MADENQEIDYENDDFARAIEEAERKQGIDPSQSREDGAEASQGEPETQEPPKEDKAFQDEWDNATSGIEEEPQPEPEQEEQPKAEEEAPEPEPESVEEEEEIDLSSLLNDAEEDSPEEGEPKAEEEEEPETADDLKNPHDSAKYKERLDRALDRGKKQGRKEAEAELQEKIKQLEDQLQSTSEELQQKAETPELSEEERTELQMLRRRFSAERDPEIKEKFDDRIKANESSIHEILKSHFPSEEQQKILEESGVYEDFEKFARSDPKGYKHVIEHIREKSPYDADAISKAAVESSSIKREKSNYINELSQNAEEYFAKQEESQKQAEAERQKAAQERTRLAEEYFKDLTTNPKSYLRKKEIPQGVTQQQREFIEKRNKVIENSQSIFKKATQPQDYGQLLDIAYAASSVPVLKDTIRGLNAQLREAKDELERRKNAGKTSRSKSHSGNTQIKPSKNKYADMDLDEAISQFEREKMGG